MNRLMYETKSDLEREAAVIERVAELYNCEYHKLPHRDRLDYAMSRNGKIVSFIEIKCRGCLSTTYDTIMMTMDKVLSARKLQQETGLPAYMVVAYADKTMIMSFDCKFETVVGGRRDRDDQQDIGLVALFSKDDFMLL